MKNDAFLKEMISRVCWRSIRRENPSPRHADAGSTKYAITDMRRSNNRAYGALKAIAIGFYRETTRSGQNREPMFLIEDGEDPLELWDWVSRAKSLGDLFIRTLRLTQINTNCGGIATFFKSFVEAPMSSLDRQTLA